MILLYDTIVRTTVGPTAQTTKRGEEDYVKHDTTVSYLREEDCWSSVSTLEKRPVMMLF